MPLGPFSGENRPGRRRHELYELTPIPTDRGTPGRSVFAGEGGYEHSEIGSDRDCCARDGRGSGIWAGCESFSGRPGNAVVGMG